MRVLCCANYKLVSFFLILLVSSCSLFSSDEGPDKSEYSIDFIHPDWQEIPPEDSDRAFLNRKNGDVIIANSFCNKYQDNELSTLAERALSGIGKLTYENKMETTFNNKEAYIIYANGKLDGVKVYLKLMNYRRNNCYYDFLMISSSKITKPRDSLFSKFLNSIQF
jgi:hypothetical protein